jgi:G6PDH family F420-dependent oxidoreductase
MSDLRIGLTLSSEEQAPARLVELAAAAERHGFDFVSISDHFHPWTTEQGHSPFVWTVLGGIAARTERIDVAVGVTCPIIRLHPAIVAHAAATTAQVLPDRFTLGVGTGENLNEHVLGDRWPAHAERLEMLEEAVAVMRRLWTGESVEHRGRHYTVEHARLFDLPPHPIPVVVSAFGTDAAEMAARTGDGLWTNLGGRDVVETFDRHGGHGPRYAQVNVCWAEDRDEAVATAHRVWPNSGVPGQLPQDLPTVLHLEQAASLVTPEMVASSVSCGPDPEPVVDVVRRARGMGIDHVYLHQVGPDQEGFLGFWDRELRHRLAEVRTPAGATAGTRP